MNKVIELFPKQLEFITRPERIGILLSGVGYGKSYSLATWIILKALQNPKANCAMASKDHGQLVLALDAEVKLVLHQMGLVEGTHYKRIRSPKLEYRFNNGSVITGLSAQNYESSMRGINLSFLALDEAAFYEKDAFFAALGRVRVAPTQIRVGTTTQGYNYIYDYFIGNPPKDSFVIKATTQENFLLPPEYFQSLKDSYPDKLFQQECLAEFIDMTAEAAYYAFSKEFNVAPVKMREGFQIYCGLDFNVSPMCSVLFQIIDNKIMVFDEIVIPDNADTYKFSSLLMNKYGKKINIIADSTGGNRSTVGPSNHAILSNSGFALLPSKNPFVFDRVMAVNKMLQDRKILIDPSCPHLIKCLSKTTWNKVGKLDQTKDKTLSHSSDSLGYSVVKLFPPAYGTYKSIDRSSSVLIESNQNY